MTRISQRIRGAGVVAMLGLVAACGSDDSAADPGATGGKDGGLLPLGDGGGGGADGSTISQDGGATTQDGGGTTMDGGTTNDGGTTTGDGGMLGHAGNPNGSCGAGIPTRGQAVDTSHPTTVVGTGAAASCTFAALNTAVTAGGIVTFNCGSVPITIPVTATLNVPSTKNTVIDGGNLVTLDGGGTVQIMKFYSANFQANENGLTLQHIALVNGKTTPTQAIPTAPAPCSQGFDDGEGGAVYMRDGNLTVIDSVFTGNQAALRGPDTGGGAIYVVGSKHGVMIVKSTFTGNKAANGGAVGCLFAELDVYDSLVTGNIATGDGANSDDATQCNVINNGQHEVGSGGNGGALYGDGNSFNLYFCGDAILDNNAGTGAFGGGIFFTSDNMAGTLSIIDSTITGNTGGHWTNVSTGSVTNAGTAVGTNAHSITITNSTIQGYP